MAPIMTRQRRFGNSRFADSYVPYGLFVLISIVSLALAGCSGAAPTAEVPEATPEAPATTPEAPQPSTVTILADSDTVEAGQPVSYTVNASPAPTADLTVHVVFMHTGVERAAEPPPATITIDAGSDAAMLTVPTEAGPGGKITASVLEGDGYTVGPAASASVTVTASSTGDGSTTGPVITRPRPQANLVTITAVIYSVVEGNDVQFRVTAEPAPAEDLTLIASVTASGPMRTTGNLPTSVTIPASTGSVELTFTTTDDGVAQGAGTVTATLFDVASGPATYRIGSRFSATVTVTDDDRSTATIGLPASVSAGAVLTITVHMSTPSATTQSILVLVHDFGSGQLGSGQLKIHIVGIAAGATSQTVAYTVSTGYAAAPDRIRAWLYGGTYAHATYVIVHPSAGRVDVN